LFIIAFADARDEQQHSLQPVFFGWEAVDLVSYLLIGEFFINKPSAIFANMKAFVNRVGDFGFILGIGSRLLPASNWRRGVCQQTAMVTTLPGNTDWMLVTRDLYLSVHRGDGASAQFPPHAGLPD
jgi:NADH:ubiquinone oxidoreductase subunit 5 (subunit L)/multisubunit Na+/H+ antiporter MnhA subunit